MPGLSGLSSGDYTPPNRTDPSSWWRDHMVRRSPGFVDQGPYAIPPPPPSPLATAAPTNPPIATPDNPGAQQTPITVGGPGPEVLGPIGANDQIGGMHPLTWLELYRGVPRGSLGGPV